MKQKAFTLMEILLTVGIIGIIATAMIRVLPNVMPDINKAKFLRAYTVTKTLVNDIINAVVLYPDEHPVEDAATYGFKNTTAPVYGIYASNTYSGTAKFPLIFADMLGVNHEDVTKNDPEYSFYVPRDNLTYTITAGANSSYAIRFANDAGLNLGGVDVTFDGKTSCVTGAKDYCTGDMADLRRQ